ncbi:hypothetical protein [Thioclava sp. GXIMD4216]|uniref:hypothetical protein n=1 Tax=unclassified Thioclava TaxID=2621713 RepID=UPI0030CD2D9F
MSHIQSTHHSDQTQAEFPQAELLRLFRLQMQSLDNPPKNGWLRGLAFAQKIWGRGKGAEVFADMAVLMDRVLTARKSPMRYGNPDCDCCAHKINPLENYLLRVVAAHWEGKPANAEPFAIFLSEANAHEQIVKTAARLAALLPKPAAL